MNIISSLKQNIALPKIRRRMLVEKILSEERLMENCFLFICEELELREDEKKFSDSIFYFKKDKFIFEIDAQNTIDMIKIYCSIENCYKIFFKNEFKFSRPITRDFVYVMIKKFFKFNKRFNLVAVYELSDSFEKEYEEHFKLNDVIAY